jgi:hypothetical protein
MSGIYSAQVCKRCAKCKVDTEGVWRRSDCPFPLSNLSMLGCSAFEKKERTR